MIEIVDRAGGVTNQVLEKMTQPFFTTKAVGEGTGMGLAICKKIVLQHGGEMKMKNNPHGLTVGVQLPRKRS
ncbi:ATP-binding protein [Vibrio olivae]